MESNKNVDNNDNEKKIKFKKNKNQKSFNENADSKHSRVKNIFSSIAKALDESPNSSKEEIETPVENVNASNSIAKKDKLPVLRGRKAFSDFFKKNTLTVIEDALDEDISEMESLSDVSAKTEVNVKSKKMAYSKRMYFVIGVIFTFMSVIGLIFSANFCINYIKRFTDNTAQKEEFARFIYPLVVTDIPEFDSVSNLSSESIITAAIWDLIIYGDLSSYEKNIDIITVPEIDIEQHAQKLFGSDITITHKAFNTSSIRFYYNEENKSYNIPISPTYYSYIPVIEDIEKEDKQQYKLNVAYKRDNPSWLDIREGDNDRTYKYIEYTLNVKDNEYSIVSIKNVSANHEVSVN